MKDTFLSNNTRVTFLEFLKEQLDTCLEFYISVSFIKYSGLDLIIKNIEDALVRGAKGKLITTTYQNFTDIKSLNKLYELSDKYSNFEVNLEYDCLSSGGFHTKGYLFKQSTCYAISIGSTNFTYSALKENREWNLCVMTYEASDSYLAAKKEFDELWKLTYKLDNDLISKYEDYLDYIDKRSKLDLITLGTGIKPNVMQKNALTEIERIRNSGENKALVIGATGAGKTLLAVLDAKKFNPKRLLFVVKDGSILRKAKSEFERIFKNTKTYGIFDGVEKDKDADFIFTTNLSMSGHLTEFEKDAFDYIIIDEAHHSAATTYQAIMNYFKYQFLIGLTATPDRCDDPEIVYALFDYNIACEIRLRQALENNLVAPFRYFGIKDDLLDYTKDKNEADETNRIIAQSTSDSHIDFMISEIEKKEHAVEGKLKCVVFCRSVEHARTLADKFSDRGYKSLALSGSDSAMVRQDAFIQLQDDNNDLRMIFAVDVLNEGVDIPAINMVIFLRPTESSIIFTQQLGRGLRKCMNKKYLVVLDFIAHSYERSINIIKTFGDLYITALTDKRALYNLVKDDFSALGLKDVQITFDEKSKEDVLDYIERTNFNLKDYIIKDYKDFKHSLGLANDYPRQVDYLNLDIAPDLIRFLKCSISGTKNVSYYRFLQKVDSDSNLPYFEKEEIELINNLSKYLPLVRPEEYLIIDAIINGQSIKYDDLVNNSYGLPVDKDQYDNALIYLTKDRILDDKYNLTVDLTLDLISFLEDTVNYGLKKYKMDFGFTTSRFTVGANYETIDVLKKINKYNPSFQRGTIENNVTGKIIILATIIKKTKKGLEHLDYNDKFINEKLFQWETTTGVTLGSDYEKKLTGKECLLFIRKSKSEDNVTLPYTFVGSGTLRNPRQSTNAAKTLLFDCELDEAVPSYLHYEFKINE